jgi:hypothetical protein
MEGHDDRRSKLIFLTAAGKKLGKEVEPWLTELYSMVSRDMDMSTINKCMEIVQQMVDNVKTE